MSNIENISLKIKNYKCFGEQAQGYDKILPINLIIGRNNTGKSTLLDLIDYVTTPKSLNHLSHKGKTPQVILSDILSEGEVSQVFRSDERNIASGVSDWNFGLPLVGKSIDLEIQLNGSQLIAIGDSPNFNLLHKNNVQYANYESILGRNKGNPFSKFTFKRLLADRDIFPEPDSSSIHDIKPNGRGATNAIQRYLNYYALPRQLVEDTLLKELNSILEPDGTFTRILVQLLDTKEWELYLEEADKGAVQLTHTGSGLKTILLVLVFINLIPHIENKPLSDYLFGFEELENNLHPALQRRLLLYLRDKAVKEGCRFFLTTHSNIAIDLFASDDQAQIIHVTHDGKCASAKRITTYVENKGILDDLDIRASDVLQANGIVWVEGPSDRLYFNRWIELWSDGKLKEGTHYQCVFYGGRLLAHLSVEDPDVDTADAIKILKVNRNAIIIIDSDKRSESDEINKTKKRILKEVQEIGFMGWLTEGKEVENYIPHKALIKCYNDDNLQPLEKLQNFADYLDIIKKKEVDRFKSNKVTFAEKICPYIVKEDIEHTLDLADKVEEAYQTILQWNRLRQ